MERLKYGAHSTVLYETVRRIKGKTQRKVNILRDNDRAYTTIPEIAEKLARTLNQVFSNDSYTEEFSRHKRDVEQESISFNSDNAERYNKPFS